MALKRYIKTTQSSGGDTTVTIGGVTYQVFNIATVASGYELATVSMRIIGGDNGGELHVATFRGGNIVERAVFTVNANGVIILDAKEFYEAGDTLSVFSAQTGITVAVSADYSAFA